MIICKILGVCSCLADFYRLADLLCVPKLSDNSKSLQFFRANQPGLAPFEGEDLICLVSQHSSDCHGGQVHAAS